MIKYEFLFRPGKGLTKQEKAILTFELRALTALCVGEIPNTLLLKGEWSGLVLMLARHDGRLVGYSFCQMFESQVTTYVHPAYQDEELEVRLPSSLKFSKRLRLMWRRSKIPASLLSTRLLP